MLRTWCRPYRPFPRLARLGCDGSEEDWPGRAGGTPRSSPTLVVPEAASAQGDLRQDRSNRQSWRPSAFRRVTFRQLRVAGLLVVLATLVAACGRTYYTPEISGVVAAFEGQPDGTMLIRLVDGTAVTPRPRQVYGGGSPQVGDLLLTGTQPEPWFALSSLGIGGAGCFWMGGAGQEEFNGEGHTSYVLMDVGLRLPEVPGLDRGRWPLGGRWETAGVCLNQRGEVYSVSNAGLGG
jgi:hypothetical protein